MHCSKTMSKIVIVLILTVLNGPFAFAAPFDESTTALAESFDESTTPLAESFDEPTTPLAESFNESTTLLAESFNEPTTPLDESFDVNTWRLPLDITPINYKIQLIPHLLESDGADRFTFSGDVTIEIKASKALNVIIMHSKNLKYTLREYWSAEAPESKKPLIVDSCSLITDKCSYILDSKLTPNKSYFLHFVYKGTMDDDMRGFYRSSYVDKDGVTQWIGSTHLQRINARRVFPSFDEPKFKATFTLTIGHHKSMNVKTNTRILNTSTDGEYVVDEFVTTPKMSCYLVAILVSPFTERASGDDFGVIARPEYFDQSEYSYEVGLKLLSELSKYLGIDYYTMGNDKMHMAAIPDFSAGAMENWGLLTFRERILLYQKDSTPLNMKQYGISVVTHEQAHMWFGDLVTCDWWSYTWLNEGFARYFQYFGTAWVETTWEMEKQFVVDQVQIVMSLDATNSTNPMSNEDTNTPSELTRMFNSISYSKGATFIRMMKHAMGETNFQKSLQDYLKQYQHTNTVPQNLLDHWLKNWPADTEKYAEAVFKSYTEQVGYPVLNIEVSNDSKSFQVTQKRFLLKPGDGADDKLQYTVPFTYTTNITKDFTPSPSTIYIEHNDYKKIIVGETFDWVIANIQEVGYYRVNYNLGNWHRLHQALYKENWDGIHELNRAQIVDDLLNLARSGELDYEVALEVLEYLETETNYLPWTSAFNGFSYLAARLGSDTEHFGKYILQLTEKLYKKLGFEERSSDSALDIHARDKVLLWSCKYGNTECISKAQSYFRDMTTKPVPANIRTAVYCTAMRYGSEADFNMLLNKFKKETVATELILILNTLGCVKDKNLVEKYYGIIVGDDVRRQDKTNVLTWLYTENSENVMPVFDLVTGGVDELAKALGDYSNVATVISNIAALFTDESQEAKLKEFNKKNMDKFGSAAATLEAAEKTVAENLVFSKEKLSVFRTYLKQRNGASSKQLATFSLMICALLAYILQ